MERIKYALRFFLSLATLLLFLTACRETDILEPALQASPPAEASPTASLPPTPSPTPEIEPTPTPKISAAWYRERNAQIASFLRAYEPAISEDEIASRLAEMEIDPELPMVALTFDDGPVMGVTDAILDILEQYHARATFFVCGWRLKKAGALLPRMLSLGCEIGNHTWGHDKLPPLGRAKQIQTVTRTNEAVAELTGYTPKSLRPPGGSTSTSVRKTAGTLGMAVVLWSQSGNVHLTNPKRIAENVWKQSINGRVLQSGDIVLLHDTKAHMVEAVALLVPELLEAGYQLVTVQELLSLSEAGFQSGVQYRSQTNRKE